MIDIQSGSIYDLLPPNLKTPEKKAIAAAIKRMFDGTTARLSSLLIYAAPGAMDNQMCDILAATFRVSAYDQTFDIDTKRGLVESALRVSATKGTAASIREIITTIHGGARLEEWFRYNGEPFHFKIAVDAFKRGIDEAGYEKLIEIIDAYKSAGTILEGIIVNMKLENSIFIGKATLSGDFSLVMPEVVTEATSHDNLSLGVCGLLGEEAMVMPEVVTGANSRCGCTIAIAVVIGEQMVIPSTQGG